MDEFAKKALMEFRHYSADLGIVPQRLDPRQDFGDESLTHMWHSLFRMPASDRFQIRYG